MQLPRWFLHPISIFVGSIIAMGCSIYLYIHWYFQASEAFDSYVQRAGLSHKGFANPYTWYIIVEMSLLMVVILVGLLLIFVYYQKTIRLYRLQENFISNFTHELKTPLTSIRLYLETIAARELPHDKLVQFVGRMNADVERLSANVDRILSSARIERADPSPVLIPTDIGEYVRCLIHENQHHFQGIEIEVEEQKGEMMLCSINPPLFEMALMNVLTNAKKYNANKSPRIAISMQRKPKTALLRISDNGIGVERKELRAIFKKFYQVGKSSDMTAKGSGVGLYLAFHIARLHRGKIWCESAGIGHGSSFVFELPIATTAGKSDAQQG